MKTLKQRLKEVEIDEYILKTEDSCIDAIIEKVKEWLQEQLESGKFPTRNQELVFETLIKELEQ